MEADFNYHGDVVVFDLDDTLMLERDYCRSGFRLIAGMLAARHGAQWLGISKRLDTILRRRGAYFDFLETQLAREAGLSDAALRSEMQQLVDAYRSHVPKRLNLRPGVREMLDELRRRRVVMAMITDGRSVTHREILSSRQHSDITRDLGRQKHPCQLRVHRAPVSRSAPLPLCGRQCGQRLPHAQPYGLADLEGATAPR